MRYLCLALTLGPFASCADSSPTGPSEQPPAAALASVEVDPLVVGGQSATGRVVLNAPAPQAGVTIALTADSAAVTVPASLTVAAGATRVEFAVVTAPVTRTTDVTITARTGSVTRTAPIRLRIDPATVAPSVTFTVGFSRLGENRAPVATHEESGFTVAAVSTNWMAVTTFGNPAPFIQFMATAGVTTTGEIRITAGGAPFWLRTFDLYSSTTRIPYVVEGFLGSVLMFTQINVLGNTFGNFARVSNMHAGTPVDVLLIRLSNPAAPCCSNPMGVDNIVMSR